MAPGGAVKVEPAADGSPAKKPRSAPADSSFQATVKKAINHKTTTIVMTVFTVYALFGDDVRLAGCPKSADDAFYGISCVALFAFLNELVWQWYAKPEYRWSFYFWLDSLATLSIIPDIGWIWEPLTGTGDSSGGGSAAALKAGRASRAGTKAGRIVRIVRLVRMVRIVKLYKMHGGTEDVDLEVNVTEPSQVGNKLQEITTRKLIILVLTMVLCLPFFDGGLDEEYNQYQDVGLINLHRMPQDYNFSGGVTYDVMQSAVDNYVRDAGRLIYLDLCDGCEGTLVTKSVTDAWVAGLRFQKLDGDGARDLSAAYSLERNPENDWKASEYMQPDLDAIADEYRDSETNGYEVEGCYDYAAAGDTLGISGAGDDDCTSTAFFDNRATTQLAAGMNMVKTVFVMIVLVAGSYMFNKDAQTLVIGPIERMIELVNKLAENPLASTQRKGPQLSEDKDAADQGYETLLLEHTLQKVGALLQVGFGAAGAEIIGKNMGSGALNSMVPGKKITSIYGFCDIRQFTDTTECLQEEVMVYVNKLGDIVHGCTHAYYGMANKNVGDAFLLSWKICDGVLPGFGVFDDQPNEDVRVRANETHKCPPNQGAGRRTRVLTPTEMAESAVTAFLKCIVDLDNANTAGTLTEYASHPRVLKRFGTGFRIRMGFGMHVGWAIEGAIGSNYKIDATYLSPHVEMSDRLEAGSKIFGTPLNISHWLYALLGPAARGFLRKMDRIKVSGCSQPMTVYTFDVVNMKIGFGEPVIEEDGFQRAVDFANDAAFRELQEGLNPGFVPTANSGVQAYLDGNWAAAKTQLEAALELKPNDGPCLCIMKYMAETEFQPGETWGTDAGGGYRHLDGY